MDSNRREKKCLSEFNPSRAALILTGEQPLQSRGQTDSPHAGLKVDLLAGLHKEALARIQPVTIGPSLGQALLPCSLHLGTGQRRS